MSVVLPDWAAHHGRYRPTDIAVADSGTGEQRTWAELDARVGRLASVLRDDWGVAPGDRVVLVAENGVRVFEVQFACMRIGAIFMPLNWRLTAHELGAQLADATPVVVLHDGPWSDLVDQLAGDYPFRHRAGWDAPTVVPDYDRLIDAATPVEGGTLDPDAVIQLLYTSGTTGKPKGLLCTNLNVVTQAWNLAHVSRFAEPGGHHLNVVPLFHAGGLNVFTNPMLYWGGRVTTMRRFDADDALDLLTDPDLGITHLCGVLQNYEWLVRLERFAGATFPTLHTALFGGWGPSAREVHRGMRAHGIHTQLAYGASELGPNVSVLSPPDDDAADRGSSGRLLPHTMIRLTTPDGVEVAPGEVGELWVRGPGVTPGYWGVPRDEFFDGEWFRTGDAARLGPDGHLHIEGRVVDRYRSGGENVYPAEVENVLADLPGVGDMVVVGVPDERWGETGLLAVTLEPGASLTLAEVHAYTAGRLARFKLPAHLLILDDLPRSATQKIARGKVRELFTASAVTA